MDTITWRMDLDSAEFFLDLLQGYQDNRLRRGLKPDIGVQEDIAFLEGEIETVREFSEF